MHLRLHQQQWQHGISHSGRVPSAWVSAVFNAQPYSIESVLACVRIICHHAKRHTPPTCHHLSLSGIASTCYFTLYTILTSAILNLVFHICTARFSAKNSCILSRQVIYDMSCDSYHPFLAYAAVTD